MRPPESAEAAVSRLSRTFGFVRRESDGVEVFVPGKYFMGAMSATASWVAPIPPRGVSPEGQIVKILEYGRAEFTGTMALEQGVPYVQPDSMIKFPDPPDGAGSIPCKARR